MHKTNIGINIRYFQCFRIYIKCICKCLNKIVFWNTGFFFILSHTDIGGFFIKANLSSYIFLSHSAFGAEEMDSFSYCHGNCSFRCKKNKPDFSEI